LGIFEILLFLAIALIVIPPDDLPQVMRAVGKVMRELRLASNTVMREISGAIGDDAPFNILPPRFDDAHPAPTPSASPSPPPPAFLAPEIQPQPPAEIAPAAEAANSPQATDTSLIVPSEHPASPVSPPSNDPAPEPASAPRPSGASANDAAPGPRDAARPRATGELTPADHEAQAKAQTPPPRPRRTRKPKQPSVGEAPVPPADKP
jgi:mttA/Hcf106 family